MTDSVICFCNANTGWGGGEKWHLEAAVALAGRGRHVLVMAAPEGRLHAEATRHAETLDGMLRVVPVRIGRLTFLDPLALCRIARLLRRERVDTVITGLPSDLKAVGLAARLAGVRQVFYRRGSALPVRDTVFNRFLYGRVLTGLIVNSLETRELVLVNNPQMIADERIHLLHNGIDAVRFDAALEAAQPEYRPTPETLVIGNAGRLNRQKGQHHLLHLARHLQDAGLDFRLVIAGEGERREELENLAMTLGVERHVVFAGFQADLGAFWKSIDIFVLSSHWEGFGYVLAEAMLARCPVVAFAVSNIPELVQDGQNGILVAGPDNVPGTVASSGAAPAGVADASKSHASEDAATRTPDERLAAAVMQLAVSPALRERMGIAGRVMVLRRYAQSACMDRLEQILDGTATPQ